MSSRIPSSIVGDILRCIEHIETYTSNLSFDEFSSNFMVIEACLYNIQIIGEAVNQLPNDVKEANGQIPWILIKGMRNRLIHEYFGTDLPLVWNTIKNDLPAFTRELKEILGQLKEKNR
ncbi:MAG TPA: DUF86 domain-containing protein [Dinghuibacter sp.]|uniref:HepT-like ribonuclease domain-containing protein n=1 Tax=Dinghuibacter sp. TaxID=2024697 RepID=UPI002BFC172A|nr:DUF86 domain-containing protein [Dinghuibacter sp.]HTJ11100.1 DUF86 domain-containing protein [Dinghuibacter sp.]